MARLSLLCAVFAALMATVTSARPAAFLQATASEESDLKCSYDCGGKPDQDLCKCERVRNCLSRINYGPDVFDFNDYYDDLEEILITQDDFTRCEVVHKSDEKALKRVLLHWAFAIRVMCKRTHTTATCGRYTSLLRQWLAVHPEWAPLFGQVVDSAEQDRTSREKNALVKKANPELVKRCEAAYWWKDEVCLEFMRKLYQDTDIGNSTVHVPHLCLVDREGKSLEERCVAKTSNPFA